MNATRHGRYGDGRRLVTRAEATELGLMVDGPGHRRRRRRYRPAHLRRRIRECYNTRAWTPVVIVSLATLVLGIVAGLLGGIGYLLLHGIANVLDSIP